MAEEEVVESFVYFPIMLFRICIFTEIAMPIVVGCVYYEASLVSSFFFEVSFVGLDPKVKPVELLPKAGALLPKLMLPEPKEKAPACLTPLVLAKFDPMNGVFEGDDDDDKENRDGVFGAAVVSSCCSFALFESSVLDVPPPKPKRYELLAAVLAMGDDGEVDADPKEKGGVFPKLKAAGVDVVVADFAKGLEATTGAV